MSKNKKDALALVKEKAKLQSLCRDFNRTKLQRLFNKADEGKKGFDNPENLIKFEAKLAGKVYDAVLRDDLPEDMELDLLLDISNYAMFLWQFYSLETDQ